MAASAKQDKAVSGFPAGRVEVERGDPKELERLVYEHEGRSTSSGELIWQW